VEASNRKVSEKLNLMGEILELLDDNPFKVRAYRRAAESISKLAVPVESLSPEDLEATPGIGAAIAKRSGRSSKPGHHRQGNGSL